MKARIATALAVCAVVLAACQTAVGPSPAPVAARPAPAPAAGALTTKPAATARGAAIFTDRCKDCHDPPAGDAPTRAMIAMKPPAELREILKTGLMQPMAEGLSDDEISALIEFLKSPA